MYGDMQVSSAGDAAASASSTSDRVPLTSILMISPHGGFWYAADYAPGLCAPSSPCRAAAGGHAGPVARRRGGTVPGPTARPAGAAGGRRRSRPAPVLRSPAVRQRHLVLRDVPHPG